MDETLRSIGAMDASALDADRQRLVAAAVTAATILEPAASDPRLHGLPLAAPAMADAAGGDPGSRGAITLASVNGATVPLEPATTFLAGSYRNRLPCPFLCAE